MDSFFARYKNSLVLVLVLAAQFVLLAVQVRPRLPGAAAADQSGVQALRRGVTTVVTPPEKVAHSGGLGLRGIWSNYVDLIDLKQQNEQLQAENQQLQMEQAALSEDARQGERLQELLAFKQHYIDTTVPAQIVGTGGSDHGRILYIDKGSDDGLAPEMPVITPNGIVGKIRDVTPSTAQVLEISDPTSAAGVLLEQTRTRGVVRGNEVGQPEIVDLMPDSRIQPGELVLTSGGDQIFPRGLPVGTVEKIVPDIANQPLVDVILKPAANLGRLEEVLVVTSTSDKPSALARRDLARSEHTAAGLKAAAAANAAAAAEAAVEAQRASDILALRLPSAADVIDPDAPDAVPGSSPASANVAGAPLHPPSAVHADHYSPGDTPSAQDLTPGQRAAPYVQGKIPSVRVVKPGQDGDALQGPAPGVSPAFRAAHDAAMAAGPHPPQHKFAAAVPAASAPSATHAGGQPAGSHPAARAAGSSPADRGVVGETPRHASVTPARGTPAPGTSATGSGAARPSAVHAPAPTTHSAPRSTGGAAAATTPRRPASHAPVQTRVITDGPITGAQKTAPAQPRTPATQAKPPATTPRSPAVVPDDGSRPPSNPPQEPR